MRLTWRWFLRTSLRGEYLWLWLAVILASASVAFMSQLAQSVRTTMLAETVQSMGAQLVLRSTQPIPAHWSAQAASAQIRTGELIQFNTMLEQGDHFQLVSVRGISEHHPDQRWLQFTDRQSAQAVVDQQLINSMSLTLNQTISLGKQSVKIVGVNTHQDPLSFVANQIAPPVFIPIEWIESLGLITTGSRVLYELTFLGSNTAVEQIYQQLIVNQPAHWQVIRADQRDTDLETTLATAWLFLDIASLTSLLIAGLAIMLASRFYLQRWGQTLALLGALGVQQKQVVGVFFGQLLLLSVFASLLGMLMGLLTITAISPLLALWLPNFTLAEPWLAIVESLVSGVLIFWAFTLPIFWQMMRTKPHHLFRQTESSRRQQGLAWLVSGFLLISVIFLLLPSGVRVPVILGFTLVTLVLLGVAGILQTLVFRLQSTSRGWLRLVIANLKYDRMSLMVQFVAFGLVLYLLLVLTFVQGNLVNHWQASLGADTPNVFVINIQPDEQAQVAQVLTAQGIEAEMIPMLRARLVAHNGKPLSVDQFTSARAKRLLDREANVAVMTDLPEHNRIFAQITETERQTAYPAMSVERGIAELFGLKLTDQIAFEVQGMKVAFQITAIREVAWQSLQPNFFFIAQPWTQEALPVTYLTSFHHPQTTQTTTAPENTASLASLKSALQAIAPSLLWFDVQSLIVQLQQLMQQAGTAVSFLYVFALLASVLVIFSATLAAQEGRYRQWLVLRTLGAQTGQLVLIGLFEYVLIGLLAGTLSAFLAQATQMLIALYWLNLSPQWDMKLWFIGWGIGVASLVILAYLAQAPLRKLGAKQLQSRAS